MHLFSTRPATYFLRFPSLTKLLIVLLWMPLICSISKAQAQSLTKEFPKFFSVKVTNTLPTARKQAAVFIAADQLQARVSDFNAKAFVVVDKGQEIASQYNFQDKDRAGIVVVLDQLQPNESRELIVRYKQSGEVNRIYTKRTQAELSHKVGGEFVNRAYKGGEFKNVEYLRVPPEHKDHSWFIRYEGPGWESDLVGYRFYLDQRNATDVFGKVVPEPSLQFAGLDGFDSYHNMQPWGMDVMKVGKSLGIGSIGYLRNKEAIRVEKTDSIDCRIVENGVLYSSVTTNYYGWQLGESKHTLHSRLSIHAGSRLTHQRLTFDHQPDNICTGIVKDNAAPLITHKGDNQRWAYLATYGKQSLNNDQLGLAVLFNPAVVLSYTEDQFSHIVTLKPDQGKAEYYFLAAWELDPDGIKSQDQFIAYLDQVASELANPLQVEIATAKRKK